MTATAVRRLVARIRTEPGSSVPELAAYMAWTEEYLLRVLRVLEGAGVVQRQRQFIRSTRRHVVCVRPIRAAG